MSGRERLLRLVNRLPTDRLCWTTLIDRMTQSAMPEEFQRMSPLDFYRRIGCDILQFGNYGLPENLCVGQPFRRIGPETETEELSDQDGNLVVRSRTRWGVLTSSSRGGHPVKHPVESIQDLQIFRNQWLGADCEETDGMAGSLRQAEDAIGDRGIYAVTLEPSPVQQLIEVEMGLANFYYLLNDYRSEMEDLLAIMHAVRMKEYEIIARRTEAEVVIPVENTSSTLTSPAIYERYSLPQISDLVSVMHRRGKKVVLHMCGFLRKLLPLIRETGLDGINAVTPPTIGDTPFEFVLDVMGDDFPIMGGIFNANVFQKETVAREEIRRGLDALYTPRIRQANLLLWLPADGLPTPPDRFLWVKEWMESNGAR